MQDRNTVFIAEGDMVKRNISFDLRHLNGIRCIFYCHRFVNRLKDTFQIRNCREHTIIKVCDRIDRLPEAADICCKRDQLTGCHAIQSSIYNAVNTDHIYKCRCDRGDQIDHRSHCKVIDHGTHPRLAITHTQTVKYIGVFFLPHKRLRHTYAVNAFGNIGIQVRLLIALYLPSITLLLFEKDNIQDQHRQATHTYQCQLYAHRKHKDQNKDQVAQICDRIQNTI